MKTSNPKYCRCGAPLRKLGKRVMVCERKTSDHKHYWNGAIGLTDPSTIAVLEELDEALSDAARLRALLRELVAEMEEYVKPKVVIEMYDRELVTTASVARCRELVARARAEVGGGE